MICPKCNKEIKDRSPVCEYCGQEFAYEEYEEETVVPSVEKVAPKATEEAEESVKKPSNKLSIAAFVCAICSIVFIFTPVGFILSLLALIFNRAYKKSGGDVNKVVKATKIIGIIVIIISGIITAMALAGGSIFAANRWDDIEEFCEDFADWVGDFFKLFRAFK